MILTAYNPLPPQVELGDNDVHVYCSDLDDTNNNFACCADLLSAEERERAGRFVFGRDRDRYTVSRAILKKLIMKYTGISAKDLSYANGPQGKPTLQDNMNMSGLRFNISRSGGYGLFAFAQDREVGIDIEQIREVPEMDQIISTYFSSAERDSFASLTSQEKKQAFFKQWTRKEALAKALGLGLSMPMRGVDIPLAPGKLGNLVNLDGVLAGAGQWTIRNVSPFSGYSAALAVEGTVFKVMCWNWRPKMLAEGTS